MPYEAAFREDPVFVAVDILERTPAACGRHRGEIHHEGEGAAAPARRDVPGPGADRGHGGRQDARGLVRLLDRLRRLAQRAG